VSRSAIALILILILTPANCIQNPKFKL